MTCTCTSSGWPDPDCPKHGLCPGQSFPPMDRHALPGEDARAAQRRLYLESIGKKECLICGRVGSRGFAEEPPTEIEVRHGRTDRRHRCRGALACGHRSRQRDASVLARLHLVTSEVRINRFVYGDEAALQGGIEGALTRRWAVVREHRLAGRDRVDLYLPALRVGVETKIAGTPGDILRQCLRYLDHPDIDALLLITNQARHQLPAELSKKPVAVVWLGTQAL